MNEKLRTLKDGTGRVKPVWCDVAARCVDGITRRQESVEVYWPFALDFNVTTSSDHNFDILHLPSGYYVLSGGKGLPRKDALALIRKLRPMGDWSFTKPNGKKWNAIKDAAGALVKASREASK